MYDKTWVISNILGVMCYSKVYEFDVGDFVAFEVRGQQKIGRVQRKESDTVVVGEYQYKGGKWIAMEGEDCSYQGPLKAFTYVTGLPLISEKELECLKKYGITEDEYNKLAAKINVPDGEDCVEYKIPLIREEYPDMNQEQIVAIATSMCKE